MTGIDRERTLREAYPDPQERLAARLERVEREASDLGRALGPLAIGRANPHRSGKHARPRITVSVPAELHAQVLATAEEEAISVSEWVCEAVRAYLLLAKRDRLTDADWRKVVSG